MTIRQLKEQPWNQWKICSQFEEVRKEMVDKMRHLGQEVDEEWESLGESCRNFCGDTLISGRCGSGHDALRRRDLKGKANAQVLVRAPGLIC
jgi:hypothetical protein